MDSRNHDTVLIRMDKIGDLVLSLPADEHPGLAGRKVHWFVTKGLGFIARQADPVRSVSEYPRRFSPFAFAQMVQWFRAQRVQTVVLLHNPWWVSAAAWWAGVPERIGRLSQWHSFLFVNLPVRQKRSASDRHESDFNFDLLEWGLNRMGVRRTSNLAEVKKSYLRLLPNASRSVLEKFSLQAGTYTVVHPGMAGSALNWPTERYSEFIERLAGERPVVITGTKMDRKYLAGLKNLRERPGVVWLAEELKMDELLVILASARSVVAPSTGVLHLAASLGTVSVGIYSPRKVEHPRRWGPKGRSVTYLIPSADDGGPDVMKLISCDEVYQTLLRMEANDQRHSIPLQPGL